MNELPRPPEPTLEQRHGLQRRPDSGTVMYQNWQKLLFLHWKAEPGQLQALLPEGLWIDTFDDQAWIGIVPFFMRDIRPRFLPTVPGVSNFLELNVRTYVFDRDGIPGVWFLSLDANQRLACALGRSLFKLAYRDAEMKSEQRDDWIHYSARRHGQENPAIYQYRGIGQERTAEPGSLDFFLIERYLLYSHCDQTDRFFRGRVHHSPYQFREADCRQYSALPAEWNGLPPLPSNPDHTAFVESIKVEIFGIEKLQQPSSLPNQPNLS